MIQQLYIHSATDLNNTRKHTKLDLRVTRIFCVMLACPVQVVAGLYCRSKHWARSQLNLTTLVGFFINICPRFRLRLV